MCLGENLGDCGEKQNVLPLLAEKHLCSQNLYARGPQRHSILGSSCGSSRELTLDIHASARLSLVCGLKGWGSPWRLVKIPAFLSLAYSLLNMLFIGAVNLCLVFSELPEPVVWCNPLTHEWLLPFLLFIPEPSIVHVLCLLWLPTYLGYFLLSLCLLFGSPWDCSVCFQTFFICRIFLLIAGHDVQGKEIPSTGLQVGRGQEEDSVVLGLGLLVLVSLRCEPRKPLSAALSLSSVGKLELSVSACSSLQLQGQWFLCDQCRDAQSCWSISRKIG